MSPSGPGPLCGPGPPSPASGGRGAHDQIKKEALRVSRARALIVVALVVLFLVAGGVLIYANQHRGGQALTFNVNVTGASKMTPSQLQAHEGDHITINVTSDQDGEVHLHGYDIAF